MPWALAIQVALDPLLENIVKGEALLRSEQNNYYLSVQQHGTVVKIAHKTINMGG